MSLNFKPIILIVLDGFGVAPASSANAVSLAKKPFFDSLVQNFPVHLLEASSLNVGLPQGEVGNSEVGHLTIGSGILRYQSLPRINRSISTGEFFKLPQWEKITARVKKTGCKVHIMGLLGNGGVHSSQEHLEALMSLVSREKVNKNTYFHLFLDGRDTTRDTGIIFIQDFLKFAKKNKTGPIASLCGRFYAMDRNKNWDRIKLAYDAIVSGQSAQTHTDPEKAIKESYKNNVFDEEFLPTVMVDKHGQALATIEDNDIVIFFNFRADRGRQLTQALAVPDFKEFATKKFKNLQVITFTEYEKGLPVEVLFGPEVIKNPLAKIFSENKLKQLHIAETEKYAHVTFFLNGMLEETFAGEKRILIPSPAVSSYDQKPEMSSGDLTNEILKALKSQAYDFMAINYANPDMVGHTGNLKATIKAIESVDTCLSQIMPEILKQNGCAFIVGDHGNSEELINPLTGEIDKEHNIYPVPFVIVGNKFQGNVTPGLAGVDLSLLSPVGILADVAPTMLKVAGLGIPKEMTGKCLLCD